MSVTLVIGQHTFLTANLVDSLGHPVPGADPNQIFWTVDQPVIISIGPVLTADNGQTNTLIPQVSGPKVPIRALAVGAANVTATYNNGSVQLTQVTSVIVNATAVSGINVSVGPII